MTKLELEIEGQTFVVQVGDVSRSPVTVIVNGVAKRVAFREVAETAAPEAGPEDKPVAARQPEPAQQTAEAPAPVGAVSGEALKAPMPGKILSIGVQVGDAISAGDSVCTLEAMKMEMPISATASGAVKAIHVRIGQNVAYDDPLITVG